MIEKKLTAYETAKGDYEKFNSYAIPLNSAKQGRYVDNLFEIAHNAALEVEDGLLEDDARAILEERNQQMALDYIQGGAYKFQVRIKRDFDENLEAIVGSTDDKGLDGIEKLLPRFKPKKDVGGEYEEAAKLHRSVYSMIKALGMYQNKELDEEQREDVRKRIMVKMIKDYYEDLYKDPKDKNKKEEDIGLLSASLKWVQHSPRLCLDKFGKLTSKKLEEFHKKIDGKVPDYLMAAMDNKAVKNLYLTYWGQEETKKAKEEREEDGEEKEEGGKYEEEPKDENGFDIDED